MKDSSSSNSLFTRLCQAVENNDFATVSELQIEMDAKIEELRKSYTEYKKNLLDI
jgi:glutamine synthetase